MSSYTSRAKPFVASPSSSEETTSPEQRSERDKPPPAGAPVPLNPQLDIRRIPSHLHELLVHATAWGSLPPAARERKLVRSSSDERQLLADAVGPFLDDIRAWCDGTGTPTPEQSAYRRLVELYRTIEPELEA